MKYRLLESARCKHSNVSTTTAVFDLYTCHMAGKMTFELWPRKNSSQGLCTFEVPYNSSQAPVLTWSENKSCSNLTKLNNSLSKLVSAVQLMHIIRSLQMMKTKITRFCYLFFYRLLVLHRLLIMFMRPSTRYVMLVEPRKLKQSPSSKW